MTITIADLPWLPEAPADFGTRCRNFPGNADALGSQIQALATHRLDNRQLLLLSRAIDRCRKAGDRLDQLSSFRLGVLANSTVDLLVDCLPASAARHGIALETVTASYDQVTQQALDAASSICTSGLDAVLLVVDHHWHGLGTVDLSRGHGDRLAEAVTRLRTVISALRTNANAPSILQTVPVPPYSLFGSYDRQTLGTQRALLNDLNRRIVTLATETGSYILDIAALADQVGSDHWFEPVQWYSYKLPFAARMAPVYAELVGRLLGAIRGKARKCLVLDLDNTIWGGVIGDDGLEGIKVGQGSAKGEAFLSVQRAALTLRNRGVFLAVCSKNDDEVARRPFREHPDMLLREEHISVLQANWIDKPSNLEAIAKALNIGTDALVLLDDNPAERAQVRAALPQVATPELCNDPSWYAWIIQNAGYFESVTFSEEDRLRVDAVASDAHRAEVRKSAGNLSDYLTDLGMTISFKPFDAAGRQRITQLINKTNQFNLTTRRYTESMIAELEEALGVMALQCRLKDKFGDLGMIAVAICRPCAEDVLSWDIDTWLMSCRVLGRSVEQAMLSEIVTEASRRGIRRIVGHYLPTAKNSMVADHFKLLGFGPLSLEGDGRSHWELAIETFAFPDLPMMVERLQADVAR